MTDMNMMDLRLWLDRRIERLEKKRGFVHDFSKILCRINELKKVREVVGS